LKISRTFLIFKRTINNNNSTALAIKNHTHFKITRLYNTHIVLITDPEQQKIAQNGGK